LAPELTPDAGNTRQHPQYDSLIRACRSLPPIRTAVVHPCDENSLAAAMAAAVGKLIEPVLAGPKIRIRELAARLHFDLTTVQLVNTPHSHAAAEQAVALARAGEVAALMKGGLHTDELMAEVVRRDAGIRTARRISHVFIMDVPTYPKPLFITDAAVNLFPTLEDKIDIVQNAVDLAHVLGLKVPKVALLSAVETISSKIPSTIDAAALCKMADREQITGALLDGPLALDNAINPEAAAVKSIKSAVAGKATGGDDHDLAVLDGALGNELRGHLLPAELNRLTTTVARRRRSIQCEARAVARGLYSESEDAFVTRIHQYWHEWRGQKVLVI
jgi:phosphate acetyltransferase